ncbi:MAG TPA: PAS domain S-box protein [Chloroflexia bacterium]|nr:PAS domain S-box protein [Chloroflexia bacterium]
MSSDSSQSPRKSSQEAPASNFLPEKSAQLVIQNSADIITLFDRHGTITYQSPALEQVLGYKPEERIGQNILNSPIVHPQDYEAKKDFIERSLQSPTGQTVKAEFRLRRRTDNTWRYIEAIGKNLLDNPGIQGILANYRDITERKVAEEKLAENERRFRLMVQNASGWAVLMLDRHGKVSDWNPSIEKMLGYTASDIVGKDFKILFTPQDQEAGKPALELKTALEEGRAGDENWIVRKDQGRVWVMGATTPLRTGGEEVQGFAKVVQDATDKKKLEQTQQELNTLKDEFLSIVSHDLRTPLTVIQGYGQLFQRYFNQSLASLDAPASGDAAATIAQDSANEKKSTGTNRPDRKALESYLNASRALLHQATRMNELIGQLLDVSRIQGGKLTLKLSYRANLVELVQQVMEQQQVTAVNHVLVMETEQPRLEVDYDEGRIEQVLNNLVSNAIKYSPSGTTIRVKVEKQGRGEEAEAVIAVVDQGYGIAEESQEHLFERFYRVQSSQTQMIKGLGLGLFISQNIIQQHGGRIWLESQPGKGSSFYFSLPLNAKPL